MFNNNANMTVVLLKQRQRADILKLL